MPQGWDNQIGTEHVFRAEAERLRRFIYTRFARVEFDSTLYGNAGVGNLRSDAGAGLIVRIGTGLSDSFAFINPAPERGANVLAGLPSDGFEWQLSGSFYGRYVFNDITLDGNTFKDSLSATLINEQAVLALSLAISWENWGFIFSLQSGSDGFEEQQSPSEFGALSLTYNF